jgi:hypothetical protein
MDAARVEAEADDCGKEGEEDEASVKLLLFLRLLKLMVLTLEDACLGDRRGD